MTTRAPRPLSPAQREVLALADAGRVHCSAHGRPYWWTSMPNYAEPKRVSATVQALIDKGLLETGPFVALGTPRLAIATDAGRRMLEQITAEAEAS